MYRWPRESCCLNGGDVIELAFIHPHEGGWRRIVKIDVGKLSLNVLESGAAEPALLFLHYWGGSLRTWTWVIERLCSTFRCIAYDQRGWGESDAPADGCTISDLAGDAAALIRALDLKRYVLVGHSMGGKAAQFLAAQRPIGLEALVLVAPASPLPQHIPQAAREAQLHAYDSRDTVLQAIAFLTARPPNESTVEQIVEDSLRGSAAAKLAWPASAAYEDISEQVRNINVPTLILAGDQDRQDPLHQQQTEVLPRIPGAQLEVVRESGHLSPIDQPGQLAAAIKAFLSEEPRFAAGSSRF
jgi:pimeloyl-ACP methyl ester carboxylesterase